MQRAGWFVPVTITCLVLAAAGAGWWYFGRPAPVGQPAPIAAGNGTPSEAEQTELPPLTQVPYKNAALDVGYINSQACAECHAERAKTFQDTAHAAALSDIDLAKEPADGDVVHAASGRRYKIVRRDGELRHIEYLTDGETELLLADYAVKHAVGSGRHTRSYFIEKDGFAMESPVTWYRRDGQWKMSPGYDSPQQGGFSRSIQFECINCHAGRVALAAGESRKFNIHEQRIGCERCHGPGALHAKARKESPTLKEGEQDLTIVHPGHLDRAHLESICAQCHLNTVATVEIRGRSSADFRPGRLLSEFQIHFREGQEADDGMTVVGHLEQMRGSRCYQKSETLTCTTCHDPHTTLPAEQRVEHYRSKCLTCHGGDKGCGLPLAKRQQTSKSDDCTKCHMPRGETEIPHIAFAHHRIAIHNLKSGTSAHQPELSRLVPLEDVSNLPAMERDRLQGLGWLHAGWKQGQPAAVRDAFDRARPLLEDVLTRGLKDGVVEAGLAQIAMERQDSEEAIKRAQAALADPKLPQAEHDVALWALGHSLLHLKRPKEAEEVLKKLTARQFEWNDWYALGNAQYVQKKFEGALQSVQKAITADPSRPDVQETLVRLYRELNQPEEARRQAERGAKLQSILRARLNKR